ncbi:MAG: D-Ala-D-Ala carboxypeptidase family metallohydrolase [bacterium]|nr:D-Ala-D-Ala carboxypeptidase family metallohydrolase [bacterium]
MRQAKTPAEFDADCREIEAAFPALWQTSGYRSAERNAEVGGHPESDHVIGMARDYCARTLEELHAAEDFAESLGLWALVHDKGSGMHLHVQGTQPGPLPAWWVAKYKG